VTPARTEPDPLDHVEDVAAAWLELAQLQAQQGRWEEGLRAAHVGARVMAGQNRRLAWPVLEDLLHEAAVALEPPAPAPAQPGAGLPTSDPPAGQGPACLHVLTEALEAGGHSAMAWRWIRHDTIHPVQHAAVLSHDAPIPAALAEAVHARGGCVHRPPPGSGFVQQARWLRALASALAQRVVLHVDVARDAREPRRAPVRHRRAQRRHRAQLPRLLARADLDDPAPWRAATRHGADPAGGG
jgi:hypothetical protein